jgi:tetratricopeptide (TPR) repeat protein
VGDTAAAIAAIRENLSGMERRGRTGQAMYFEVRSMLAATLADGDRQREAVDVFRRTLDAVDSSGRGGTMLRSVLDHNFAFVLTLLGETAEAESRFHEVLVSAAAGDPSGYVHSQPLIHYAESALTAGHADSAAKYFTQLARQAVADSSRYWEGRAMFGLVRAQAALGRLAEARVTADRFRTLRHDFLRLTSTDDQLPDTLAVAGWLALAAGDTAAAHQWFMASLRANRYFEGTKMHQQRAVAVRAAETAIAQGRYALIDSLVERALAVSVRDPATETRSALVGEIRLIEAKAMVARGDTGRARARLERASAALRTGAGPSHPRTAEADSLLARLRRSLAAR